MKIQNVFLKKISYLRLIPFICLFTFLTVSCSKKEKTYYAIEISGNLVGYSKTISTHIRLGYLTTFQPGELEVLDYRQKDHSSNDVLNKFRQLSQYTDPGKYAYLYDELPKPLDQLCALVKKQLIHPFDAGEFANKIPKDRTSEDQKFPTVSQMLEELLKRDRNGFVTSRKPEDRLVVACVHHSMLFASILRHRGIPVRIRAGFAKYIGDSKNLRISHVICEVWDNERNTWILVDPDRQKVDFSRHEFEFAHETWSLLRNNSLGDKQYVSRYGNVDSVTAHLLCHDLSYIIGTEEPYWEDPPIVSKINYGITDLSEPELLVLDKIAGYLKDPDNHLNDLVKIQREKPFLRFSEEPLSSPAKSTH